jgi:large subunit ribosomal protein L19
MNMNLVNEITASQIRSDLPSFSSGDTVKVHVRIIEGDKSRIQVYEGVVISTRGSGVSKTFTVRKISAGQVGVERTFFYNSPVIAKVEVVKKGKVRRNKIHYLRNLSGKAARIKEVR